MNKPLKNKRVQCPEYLDADCFDYEDLKSAVEWLKEQLPVFPDTWKKWTPGKVKELIDEAFEDVNT